MLPNPTVRSQVDSVYSNVNKTISFSSYCIKHIIFVILQKIFDSIFCIYHRFTSRSQAEQQRPPVRQDSLPAFGSQLHGGFPSSSSASFGQPTWSSGIQNQQSFSRLTNSPRVPFRPQQCTPTAGSSQSQSGKWKFRPVGQSTSEMWAKEKMDTSSVQTTPQKQVCVTLQV